jgi:uncharacterized membrane protein YfcA
MSEYSDAPNASKHHVRSPISVPWVIAASILSGLGVGFLAYWIETFQWFWFSGVLLVFVGILMFLNPRAGWDHA